MALNPKTGRPSAKAHRARPSAETAANDCAPLPARDPLLVGARAIAEHLGLTERQIYAMRDRGAPMGRVPGLGLAVRISALTAYLEANGL